MRRSIVLIAAVSAVLAVGPAMAADFSGWWRIQAQYRNGFGATPICFFQQAGILLAGTCKGPNSIGAVEGQVNGDQIMFAVHFKGYTPNGATGVGQFNGQLDSNGNMSGTSTSATGAPGTFAGMRH